MIPLASVIERHIYRRHQRIPASLADPCVEDREERVSIETDPLRLYLCGALESALCAPERAGSLSDILRSAHRAAPAQGLDRAPLIALMETKAPLLCAEQSAGLADSRERLIDALERLLRAKPTAEINPTDHPGPARDRAEDIFKVVLSSGVAVIISTPGWHELISEEA